MLNILVDENMPFVDELFGEFGNIRKMSGREMTCDDLVGIDLLLVRSITQVNQELLALASQLKFVGTATIGVDHIDQDYLAERNIGWSSAPGCNAMAVAEYVISALSVLYDEELLEKTVAIVGAGNIGTRLAKKLTALGIKYFYCDPPKERAGASGDYRDLEAVTQADIISLHVPINQCGIDSTYHLVDKTFLEKLKPGTLLINSCRGDVVDNLALRQHIETTGDLKTVIDVWQNEPVIDLKLMALVDIATPHIAGYTLEGKANGTFMLYQSWCKHVGITPTKRVVDLLPTMPIDPMAIEHAIESGTINQLVQLVYDIRDDDLLCRSRGIDAKGFDNLRKQYKVRREFSALSLHSDRAKNEQRVKRLGFSIQAQKKEQAHGEIN